MRIVIDMNLSPLWVQFLADSGFECVHWSSIGSPSAPDAEILEYASVKGCVVFTHDLDFGALLARRGTRQPSVIQLRTQDVLPIAVGSLVLRALHASRVELEAIESAYCPSRGKRLWQSACRKPATRKESRRGIPAHFIARRWTGAWLGACPQPVQSAEEATSKRMGSRNQRVFQAP
jgi:predicted nuclease of predicted toxin-antitoxin system